jgi:hypothetical protein
MDCVTPQIQMACKTVESILNSNLNDSEDVDRSSLPADSILYAGIVIGILPMRPGKSGGGNE